MSSWTCITFVPGTRDLTAVEADLRDAIQEAEADICRSSEQDDPNTWTENGYVYWYLHGFAHETTFDALDVPCERALAINLNDTSEAGVGYLYEWVDGRFLLTDSFGDNEFGRRLVDYFYVEYGIRGERGA